VPNWVYNTVTIQGPKEQVDYAKARLNTPFTRDHENWDMKTQSMKTETVTFSNPVFSFWNIHRPTDLEAYSKQADHAQQKKELESGILFQGNDWYSFNCREWGTKWDVAVADGTSYCDTYLVEHMSKGEDQWLVYRFDTAWSPPVPALAKLSNMVPNCVITLSWEEEQGFGGEIEFVRGEITADSEYESKCRDCDAEDCVEYCDNDCGQICSSCNYLGEADLDCVAECDEHKVFLDKEHLPNYRWDKLDAGV